MADKEKIENAVSEWIKQTECFLVDIKASPSKVAVYIDKPTGVSLEECAGLNKYLTATLEADGIWETHELEVSSPGIDQPLKVPQQYGKRIGREVRVLTSDGKEYIGLLMRADEKGFDITQHLSRKENNRKINTEVQQHFDYNQVKETKLIISFKL